MSQEKINYKEQIQGLFKLQEADKDIFALKKEKSGIPQITDRLAAEFETKKTNLKNAEENKQKLQLKQKEKEGELASREENIKKANGQLGQLKTNKEYSAKLAEIEGLKADKSLFEEEILKLMDEIDSAKKQIETEKNNLIEEEKIFNEKKKKINDRASEIEGLLKDREGKRKRLSDSIDPKILEKYEHILHGKDGLALVKVKDGSCHGCYMKVPHQVINEIRMHDRLITCEICARILYLEEDVQV